MLCGTAAVTVDENNVELLDTIAQLQRHLDALKLTNTGLLSMLDNARNNADEVEQRCRPGRTRDDDDDDDDDAFQSRRRRCPQGTDYADEYEPAIRRGIPGTAAAGAENSADSLGSSVATADADMVDDVPPSYRSAGAVDDAEFDSAEIAGEAPLTYRSIGGSFGGSGSIEDDDLLAAAQFDLADLRRAVGALATLAEGATPPSDAAVEETLCKLNSAMRAYLVA